MAVVRTDVAAGTNFFAMLSTVRGFEHIDDALGTFDSHRLALAHALLEVACDDDNG